jgi:hypothetical protein
MEIFFQEHFKNLISIRWSETALEAKVTAGFHRDRDLCFLKKDNKSQRPAGSFNFKAFFMRKTHPEEKKNPSKFCQYIMFNTWHHHGS